MHNDRGWFGPEPGVHVDVSYDGAVLELRRALPDEAEELLQHRFQIINVSDQSPQRSPWRSCSHTLSPQYFRAKVASRC